MFFKGVVLLNDDEIGAFALDEEEKVCIRFNKGSASVKETLEFAADQGLIVGLQLKPMYGSKD